MKISFVRPPAYGSGIMGAQLVPFLGIAYLAAVARQAGHDVDIIDMCAEDIDRTQVVMDRYVQYGMALEALATRVRFSQAFFVTSMFSQEWVFHRQLIQYLRKHYPDSLIVAGGENVTALAEYCLNDCPELDICSLGEGEVTTVNILDAVRQHRGLETVPGIAYRSANKQIKKTLRAERICDLDSLPLPAWDLIPMENYLSRGLTYHVARGRTMPMLLSRGCPYECSFCSSKNMWGQRWISRDVKKVVDEMCLYIQKYRANNFVFSDLAAVVARDKVILFCQEILERKLNITWQSPSLRTEALDEEVLRLMHASGCRELDFAIESGSEDILKGVGKKSDPQRIVRLIRTGVGIGVNMSANMVIGLPAETWKNFLESYWMVLRLAVMGMHEINVFAFTPYPGSKIFEELVAQKKIVLNDDYFFGLFAFADLSRPVSWNSHFGARTLNALRIGMMGSFYCVMWLTHPWRLIRLIVNAVRGKANTKLEGVIKRIFRNLNASRKDRHANTKDPKKS